MWKGKVTLTVPMLFTVGFLLIFLLGGITGVMVSILPFDWAVTDSYFIVAHLHYVLNGAVVFPIFGAIYFWAPKITGKHAQRAARQDQLLGDVHRLQPDLLPHAHPRRARHAPAGVDLQQRARLGQAQPASSPSARSSSGSAPGSPWSTGCWSMRRGGPAPPDPWGADTLEWATTSPPPDYNFAEIPIVSQPPSAVGRAAPRRPLPGDRSGDEPGGPVAHA